MLSFDWAPMVGGTRKFDPVQLIITVTNGSETVELDPIGHNFVNEVDKLEWLHADVVLEGVSITKDTRITIKSDAWVKLPLLRAAVSIAAGLSTISN